MGGHGAARSGLSAAAAGPPGRPTARWSAAILACMLLASCGPSGGSAPPTTRGVSAHGVDTDSVLPVLRPVAERAAAPDGSFAGVDGAPVSLRDFAGRVVVLSLWAPWCAPCLREMPSLQRLARAMPSLSIVAVSEDARGQAITERFLREHALDGLTAYHDADGTLMRRLSLRGLPVACVIDRQGRIAAVVEGEVDWDAPAVRALLESL